jgi:peroxiredoxin
LKQPLRLIGKTIPNAGSRLERRPYMPHCNKGASMSLIGTELKPFTAQAYKEGKFLTVTDADVRGRWAVFFFYPADFTFVCPTELEDVADNHDTFARMGVDVYSVSTDTHFSHKAWHDSSPAIGKIRFAMLGDPTHELSRNFNVLREGQGLADRGTFVVDPDGVIQLMEVTSEGVGRNAMELLRKIKAAQYIRANPGQVCPAKWEEGAETLAPSLDLVGKI